MLPYETLVTIITGKGFLIGFFAGMFKIMHSMREGSFKWVIAITDLAGGTITGHSVYQWASESNTLSEYQIVLLTVIFSLNSFYVIHKLTSTEFLSDVIDSYILKRGK